MQPLNKKNFNFYNTIGIDTFQTMAVQGGFNTYADLEMAAPYIQPDDTVLEIGAGYGRCIDFLLQRNHRGAVTAIEQSAVLCAHLRQYFTGLCTVIEGDIGLTDMATGFDLVLWMWSGILDFSKTEQAAVVRKLGAITHPGGRVLIDVPRMGVQTIANHTDQQHIKLTTAFGEVECYIPTAVEVRAYAEAAGFPQVLETDYETATGKQRTMYVLLKTLQ